MRVGFNNHYTKTGGFRAAIAYTRKNALLAEGNNFVVDANKLKISGGHLTPAIDPKIRINADKSIVIKWNISSVNYLNASDQLLLLMYAPKQQYAFYKIFNGAYRNMGEVIIDQNPRFTNKQVDIYIGFVAADRSAQSDSQYLGHYLFTIK